MRTIPAFEPLFWVLGTYLLLRIIQEENPRLWLGIGVIVGLGLMTRHSLVFFAFGVLLNLDSSPEVNTRK